MPTPATRRFIETLREGDAVDAVFLVADRDFRQGANGTYIHLVLADRTGQIQGKVWEADRALFDSFATDDLVRVRAHVKAYKQQLQMSVSRVERVADPSGVDPADFLPRTPHDLAALEKELRDSLGGLAQPHLRRLACAFLDDAAFMAAFRAAPAAVRLHHAYLGGLLEHVVSLSRAARAILPLYPFLDRDLLLLGVFLHDIGKIRELSYDRSLRYTDEGKLLGHIAIGGALLAEKVKTLAGFPEDLHRVLQHLVLSHHGTKEWGSPVEPATLEAVALHYLDNLDAKLFAGHALLTSGARGEDNWTPHSPMFNRPLFRGSPPPSS